MTGGSGVDASLSIDFDLDHICENLPSYHYPLKMTNSHLMILSSSSKISSFSTLLFESLKQEITTN